MRENCLSSGNGGLSAGDCRLLFSTRHGLALARATALRWHTQNPCQAVGEWLCLLQRPWEEIRPCLAQKLDPGPRGLVESRQRALPL